MDNWFADEMLYEQLRKRAPGSAIAIAGGRGTSAATRVMRAWLAAALMSSASASHTSGAASLIDDLGTSG